MGHPFALGSIFRLRNLSKYHGKILLLEYMFKNDPRKIYIAEKLISRLTGECPTHDFEIDYMIARGLGLKVIRLEEEVYILNKKLINLCISAERKGLICPFQDVEEDYKQPYFEIFWPEEIKNGK